jgi:hypothetical protein
MFDGSNWVTYNRNDGLAANSAYCITIDKEGNK